MKNIAQNKWKNRLSKGIENFSEEVDGIKKTQIDILELENIITPK